MYYMSNSTSYQNIINRSEKGYLSCASLPFAVYLSSTEGIFLQYNVEARQLFNLSEKPTFADNISTYYLHPKDRQENLEQLHQVEKGQWLRNTTIDLRIGSRICYVRDFSQAIWDETGDKIIAILSMMVKISKVGRYHRLFNDLPVGIFSLRKDEGLVNANPKFLEMHGYKDLEEVINKNPVEFLRYPSDFDDMRRRVDEDDRIIKDYQEHLRKDGSTFTASVSAKIIRGKDGQYIGTEGILEDVSTEAIFFNLVNDVPIGLYKVRINEKGAHILIHCNQHFAVNRGMEPKEMIGKDIRGFHKSMEDFDQFHDDLIRKDEEGQNLLDYILEAYNGKGALRKYEVHLKLLKDADGQVIGRVGAEKDVTDYWETKQQVKELTTDIGKVLHSYSSTLIHSKQSMDAVMRSFITEGEMNGNGRDLDDEKVFGKIYQRITALNSLLEKIMKKNAEVEAIAESTAAQLHHILDLLKAQAKNQMGVQQLAIIRDGSIKIKELLFSFAKGNFPREILKQAKRELTEILRLCSLITLSRGEEAILEMETVVNNLRSYILTRVKKKEKIDRLDIYDILVGIVRNMEEYAANRNIDIRLNIRGIRNEYINGYENDLVRALLNVLHNAIKYSWIRRGPSRAFVMVEGKKDKNWLYLNVENWGVAITQEELDKNLIFKVGYRGVNSSDRRRPGTGLGLYDTLKVIKKHNGLLKVSSDPSLGNAKDDYSNPFITRVTIQLPRKN